ncbi:hypothetical protein C9409_22140, partial [Xanthomonas vasicola pv. vasculorum]
TMFIDAYNFGRRLTALEGLTPYEFICEQWTSEPERFKVNPIHLMPGLNTQYPITSYTASNTPC